MNERSWRASDKTARCAPSRLALLPLHREQYKAIGDAHLHLRGTPRRESKYWKSLHPDRLRLIFQLGSQATDTEVAPPKKGKCCDPRKLFPSLYWSRILL